MAEVPLEGGRASRVSRSRSGSGRLVALPYRPDLDGLRAIAVALVVAYHAELAVGGVVPLRGGYLGVDIFFVITGYLISRILVSALDARGTVGFADFYERRARRIVPVLFVVVLASAPVAWDLLNPEDLVRYAKSVLAAILFGSNMFFYDVRTEYGAPSSLLEPLLHTWSLGVEAQIYLLLPLLLLVVFRWCRRHLVGALCLAAVAGLVLAEVLAAWDPSLAFYLPFARFWEVLVGSVLAVRELRAGRGVTRAPSRLLPLAGLGLIVASVVDLGGGGPEWGVRTVMVVLGTALLIGSVSAVDPVGRVLATRPLVWLGLISYSVYLWHYPVFAFARIGSGEPAALEKFGWIALTIGLSVASYWLVERPCRRARIVGRRGFVAICGVGVGLLGAFSVWVVTSSGLPGRLPDYLGNRDASVPIWEARSQGGKSCYGRLRDFCSEDAGGDSLAVHVYSDSHLSALSEALRAALAGKFTYVEANMSGCPLVVGMARSTHGRRDACSERFQLARLQRLPDGPAIVVLGGRLPVYLGGRLFDNEEGAREAADLTWHKRFHSLDGRDFEQHFTDSVRMLVDRGHHVVLVYPIPIVGFDVPARLAALTRGLGPGEVRRRLVERPLTTSAEVYRRWSAGAFELLDSLEHPNVHRVHPHTLFCDAAIAGRCMTHDAVNAYYWDDDHPSVVGGRMIVERILRAVRQAESLIRAVPSTR